MNIFNTQHLQLITAANLSSIEVSNIERQVYTYAATRPAYPMIISCSVFTSSGFVGDHFMWTVDELTAIADHADDCAEWMKSREREIAAGTSWTRAGE